VHIPLGSSSLIILSFDAVSAVDYPLCELRVKHSEVLILAMYFLYSGTI
jgi:hypothetical protein